MFDEILKADYKELPPYTTSFFPLAYLCAGKPIPEKADRGIRALMIQDRTGYMNDHIAATFHASHYYHLVGEPTPKSTEMVRRIISDQSKDGSWFLNMPSRDRHATFDAVFTLRHEGKDSKDCQAAIQRAARSALSCRNDDGGFGHFPGSTSDADANYFQIGTLVMAGFLKPVDPLPADPHLLSWGHLMPVHKNKPSSQVFSAQLDGWVGAVAFSDDSKSVLAGCADHTLRAWDIEGAREKFRAKSDGIISSISVDTAFPLFAIGSHDSSVSICRLRTGEKLGELKGHRGTVLTVAFDPSGQTLATGGIDGTIILWDVKSRTLIRTLRGHKSWVNSLVFSNDGKRLYSGSSDGTMLIWNPSEEKPLKKIETTKSEVRSIAVSKNGQWLAAGIRYGQILIWDLESGKFVLSKKGHESDVWAIAFTPDSHTLISGNGDWNRPGHIKLWDVGSGKQIDSFQHTGEVLSLAVSPDGKYLAAGGGDKVLRVWELKNPAPDKGEQRK